MDARTAEAEHDIARRHAPGQERTALGGTDREAGEVVIPAVIHAGHLGGLAADQSAARAAAAFGDARDHALGGRHIQAAGREIVEEEQRLGTLDDEIVHAHGDEIDAHRVMQPVVDGDLELGAHAIGGRDQHGVGEARRAKIEQSAETAQAAEDAGPAGGARQRLDRLDQRIPRLDIDAGLRIGGAVAGKCRFGHSGPRSLFVVQSRISASFRGADALVVRFRTRRSGSGRAVLRGAEPEQGQG